MLAVVTASRSSLMAGSVGFLLAGRLGGEGAPVALIDADTVGAALHERLGESVRRTFSPAERGLPSLIASREELTLQLLADHSYSIDTAASGASWSIRLGQSSRRTPSPADGGPAARGAAVPLWVLFGPQSREGGRLAVQWLAEHFGALARIDSVRRVVVSVALTATDTAMAALLGRIPAAVVISPVETGESLRGLRAELGAAGLLDGGPAAVPGERRPVGLVVEGETSVAHDVISSELGLDVVGSLPATEDYRVLRAARSRRLSSSGERLMRFARQAVGPDAATGAASGS